MILDALRRSVRPASCLVLLLGLLVPGCASGPKTSEEKSSPLKHYQRARMYFEQGQVPQALEEIDLSLRQDDSLAQVHFYRGYIYWNLENWAQAETNFRAALERNPYYTDARMYLATCLEKQDHPDEALAMLDAAAADRTYPLPEKIHLNKALICRRQKRLDCALAELRKVVELKPRYQRGHYEMAQVFEEMGRGAEALVAYEAAASGYVTDAEFHLRYGRALFRQRREADARRELRRAQELAPGSQVAAEAAELLGVIG